jgi:tetratricopeptide (TPR) repeat protein
LWAALQDKLANSLAQTPVGERADNVERAIHHAAQALEVSTRQAFPADWAMTQHNLASAYLVRIRDDRAENLERAIHHYSQALTFYTADAWPERAQDVRRRLGAAHFAARDWPAAHKTFVQALDLTEQFYAAALLREVREQEIVGNARMVAEDAFCLAQTDELEEGCQWPGD